MNLCEYSFLPVPGSALTSQLALDGQPCKTCVAGTHLEEQHLLRDGRCVLFATLDVPYEETLYIHLLDRVDRVDRAGILIESLEIGAPYTPGILRQVTRLSDAKLRFFFIDEVPWILSVQKRPTWTLYPRGARRLGLRLLRYLKLEHKESYDAR